MVVVDVMPVNVQRHFGWVGQRTQAMQNHFAGLGAHYTLLDERTLHIKPLIGNLRTMWMHKRLACQPSWVTEIAQEIRRLALPTTIGAAMRAIKRNAVFGRSADDEEWKVVGEINPVFTAIMQLAMAGRIGIDLRVPFSQSTEVTAPRRAFTVVPTTELLSPLRPNHTESMSYNDGDGRYLQPIKTFHDLEIPVDPGYGFHMQGIKMRPGETYMLLNPEKTRFGTFRFVSWIQPVAAFPAVAKLQQIVTNDGITLSNWQIGELNRLGRIRPLSGNPSDRRNLPGAAATVTESSRDAAQRRMAYVDACYRMMIDLKVSHLAARTINSPSCKIGSGQTSDLLSLPKF
ncbi:hypothetical protein [Ensifer adhaerens]|uniref:hypothetical protein n=1 Tax=Ensifer adhaerens TaxID=106592 RepID=UPI001319FDFF|nr:hypothetical protein [Ensifer adhaerens]